VPIDTYWTGVATAKRHLGRRTIWIGAVREDDIGMSLVPLSAEELAETPTLFASFMGYVGTSHRTLGQLRTIYRERSSALSAAEDAADDLRVDRFIEDMASNRWSSSVVMRIGVFDGTLLAIDGIHRGIAYLTCIERGISPDRLPPLHVER
jgi:hypothetical protein